MQGQDLTVRKKKFSTNFSKGKKNYENSLKKYEKKSEKKMTIPILANLEKFWPASADLQKHFASNLTFAEGRQIYSQNLWKQPLERNSEVRSSSNCSQ